MKYNTFSIFVFQLLSLKSISVLSKDFLQADRSVASPFRGSYLFREDFRVGEMSGPHKSDIYKDDTGERVQDSRHEFVML